MKEFADRLMAFAVAIFAFTRQLSRIPDGRYLGSQLMRAGASAGANYEEACGAESRADFTHKLQIVLKELREANYWLRLIGKIGLVSETTLLPLSQESEELVKLFAKSVVTVKSKSRRM
jgi:four helix bundle protein